MPSYAAVHLVPDGRPDSMKVVVQLVECDIVMPCDEPAWREPEDGTAKYEVVQPPDEFDNIGPMAYK